MTRKELVREINLILAEYDYRLDSIEKEALCKAIEALEAEPTCRKFRQIDLSGKWEDMASELDAGFGRHEFVCSECSTKANYYVGGSEDWWDAGKPNYCPNCGARMELKT